MGYGGWVMAPLSTGVEAPVAFDLFSTDHSALFHPLLYLILITAPIYWEDTEAPGGKSCPRSQN